MKLIVRTVTLSILLLLACDTVISQISYGGTPVSFIDSTCLPQANIYTLNLPFVNNDSLEQADSILHASDSSFVFRFGISIKIDKGLSNAGTWEVLPDGSRLWRIHLKSPGAYSNYLIFDKFFLPKGATLFAYNDTNTQVLGAFTEKNNKPYNRFSLGPVQGESVILEYHEPFGIDEVAEINIAGFIHDFKSDWSHVVYSSGNPAFNGSLSCHRNAICEPDWCDQRRSVALIVTLNLDSHFTRIASGALITNQKRDLTPYFLTANHIKEDPAHDVTDWIFIFNYQSITCTTNPLDTPATIFSISGATAIANNCVNGEFALVKLSKRPHGNFNTYLSGWSNKNVKPENGASIHHPQGDIKKISLYSKKGKRKKRNTGFCDNAKMWRIKWDSGGGQPGSSGGPLYNEDKRIVGQVSGVKKAGLECKKADFGRFDKSWDNGLQPKLDPTATLTAMSGDEPCKVNYIFTNANDLHTSANVSPGGPVLPGSRTYDGVYEATNLIQAGNNVTIQSGTSVTFNAGNKVVLKPGFHAKAGSHFRAYIEGCLRGCNTGVGKTDEYENYIYEFNTEVEPEEDEKDEIEESTIFNIYPNPSSGEFTIELPYTDCNCLVFIYDLMGKIIYQDISSKRQTISIDISNRPKGLYFVKIIQGKEIFTKKLIHQ